MPKRSRFPGHVAIPNFIPGGDVAITRKMAVGVDRWKTVEKWCVGADRKGSAKTG
jgi:hypothetical protein